MERGGFHGYRKLSFNTTPGSKLLTSDISVRLPELNHTDTTTNSSPAISNANLDDECTVREQDRFMPIANVIRIMRRILPPHAKISDDAKETIQECVSEYISFITGEANERCQQEQRKTITAEDVLWAMSKLGFDDYIEPLTLYLHRHRELEGERGNGGNGGSMRGDRIMGMTSGLVMQGANGMVADYGGYVPGLHLGNYHHNLNNHMNHQRGLLFGGYNTNNNFKDGGATRLGASSAVAGDGAAAVHVADSGKVPPFEQHN